VEGEVAADTIAGSKIRSRGQFIRVEAPRIDTMNRTTRQIRLFVGDLGDTHLAVLYTPLASALNREVGDLELFLSALVEGEVPAVQMIYGQLGGDEQRITHVALAQLSKVRAYARQLGG
jgi:hypothetical protein